MTDKQFMARAIELAQRGRGQTSPNPIVGAVIVKNNRIVAEGFHKKAGTDHAEIVALKKLPPAGAGGAALYVTLEPCCHKDKRTPPCVDRILSAGIQKVVIGARDPNPKVCGEGIRRLRRGGAKVVAGVLQEECRGLNKPYEKWITTGLPYVTLKVASTLDGKIATASGKSKWITNKKSRAIVHRLRAEVDAILVGAETVRRDDPLLTVRIPRYHGRQPMAVVIAGKKSLPNNRKLFKVKGRKVLVERNKKGRVDLKKLLEKLGRMGITHLLVEGGGDIFSQFIRQKRADHFMIFIAPKKFGPSGKGWLSGELVLKNVSQTVLGSDLLLEAEV